MDCLIASDFAKCVLKCCCTIATIFILLNSITQNAFSADIIFDTLTDSGTPGAAESLNNKIQVFLYKWCC